MKAESSHAGGSFLDFQGPFRSVADIILASASPRRQALLASLGICFQVIPARFREPAPEPGISPEEYALFMAREKAREVAGRKPDSVVIAADTIVVLEGTIMGKPRSKTHGLEMLSRLQGNTHQVITASCLKWAFRKLEKPIVCSTLVEMARAPGRILEEYVKSGEPADKAGAYAIQGLGAFLISSVSGSYTNVVGLPLTQVWEALLEMKVIKTSGE
jgi:septum formation protein